MSGLRITYLILAVLGAVWPLWHFVTHFSTGGTWPGLIGDWLATEATRGLTADLLVSGTALIIWATAETLVRRNWIALITLPATLFVGVSFGFPLYLFLRTRPVD